MMIMDISLFILTIGTATMFSSIPVVFGCSDKAIAITFLISLFSINAFCYFHEKETIVYDYVNKFEYSQKEKDVKKLNIFSGKHQGESKYINSKLKINLYERKESDDINFIINLDFKITGYSFNPVNNNGKVEIGYPKNFICLKEPLFYSYSRNQEVKEMFDVSETEKTYINKSFVDLEKINKLNTGNIELIFKINKYESYSLLLKDKDDIKVTKSDKNNITGLLYTKDNRRQIDNCFTQKVEIFIENEEAYQKLNNLIFYNYH